MRKGSGQAIAAPAVNFSRDMKALAEGVLSLGTEWYSRLSGVWGRCLPYLDRLLFYLGVRVVGWFFYF